MMEKIYYCSKCGLKITEYQIGEIIYSNPDGRIITCIKCLDKAEKKSK